MAIKVQTVAELVNLLKRLDLKVTSPAELRDLLTAINANYDPDEARVSAGMTANVVVGAVSFGCAGIAAFILAAAAAQPKGQTLPWDWVAAIIAIIWGAATLATSLTVLFNAVALSRWRAQAKNAVPTRPASATEPPVTAAGTAIFDKLSRLDPKRETS